MVHVSNLLGDNKARSLNCFDLIAYVVMAAGVFCGPTEVRAGLGDLLDELFLEDNERGENNGFGASVAISSNTAIVGVPGFGEDFPNAAYLYHLDGDGREAKEGGARFGSAVDLDGSSAIVGAPEAKSVIVFENDVREPHASSIDRFGWSVGISGTRAIVGAPSRREGESAAAFIIDRNENTLTRLPYPEPQSNEQFGYAVAINEQWAVVGAPGPKVEDGALAGKVYVYDLPSEGTTDLPAEPKEILSGNEIGDFFGFAVALSGNRLVVGAPTANTASGVHSGRAHVYELQPNSPATVSATLCARDGGSLDLFGASVDINGDRVVVGAPLARATAASEDNPGAAYLFTASKQSINEIHTFKAPDGSHNDAFGVSVGISEQRVIVGAQQHSHPEEPNPDRPANYGAAYIFDATAEEGVVMPYGGCLILPGDANQDRKFDQLDIIEVQQAAKYLSGQRATWGEGDWNGNAFDQSENPPIGDGLFDQLDIISALRAGVYLTGPYAAVESRVVRHTMPSEVNSALSLSSSLALHSKNGLLDTGHTGNIGSTVHNAPVPEPSTVTLFVAGLAAILSRRFKDYTRGKEDSAHRRSI